MHILGIILIILSVVVIHEFGHYLAARLFKLPITDFSIGFGPKLFFRGDSYGTLWALRSIPLGGYVKIDPEAMMEVRPFKRLLIYAAGPAMNLLTFAILGAIIAGPAPVLTMLGGIGPIYVETIKAVFNVLTLHGGNDILGPIGLVKATSAPATAANSPDAVLSIPIVLFLLMSYSLAVVNLIPLPPFDGGQMVAAFAEMMFGKKVGNAVLMVLAPIGIIVIFGLVIIVTVQDIIR